MDLICAAPGLFPLQFEGAAVLLDAPHRRISSAAGLRWRQDMLHYLAEQIDGLPQDEVWERRLRSWIGRLGDGRARALHVERTLLHGRLLSRTDRSVAFAGPFTHAGARSSADLRFELTGASHAEARAWLERWRDEATDISSDVLAVLQESWAGGEVDPEDLYLKVLYEYFRGTLSSLDEESDDNPMLRWLTDFQREAYAYAKGVLRRYGGVFLADVVGLGKTWIAMALLRHLQGRYGHHAVVVAPPAVCPAWRELADEQGVQLTTLSIGRLSELPRHADREILVLDESHNFRNRGTRRYDHVEAWLRPDGQPSARQVLLLSATPQNNRAQDVLHQLRFFPDNYTRLPFRGESLEDWFKAVERGEQDLARLLQHVVVRRTRGFIREAYPDATLRQRGPDGAETEIPLRFPRRVSGPDQCLRYQLDARPGATGLYDRILRELQRMTWALYGLGEFARPEHLDHPVIRRLRHSGRGLRGLYKVLLLKRLESSLFAFDRSLDRLRERLTQALEELRQGWVTVRLSVAPSDDADDADDGEGPAQERSHLFDVPALDHAIRADLARVEQISAALRDAVGQRDPKLARLEAWLRGRHPRRHRTLVFTQFADTASWLAQQLGDRFGRTALVTGSTAGRGRIARRFAPRANRAQEVGREDEIDLLISTDALSEGVNLQDADTLVNYDLHWNPVRLIQRAGRIDRIGSENDEIHVASFLPERGLESNLGIEEVLRHRIAEFLRVFGEDSAVLPSEERPDYEGMRSAYSGRALDDADAVDELDGLSRHVNRILGLRQEDPERYARIAELRPGRRAASAASRPALAACRIGWLWSFYEARRDGELAVLEDLDGLDRLRTHAQAGPGVPREPGAAGALARSARLAFEPVATDFLHQRRHPRLSKVEEWVLQSLDHYREVCLPTRRDLVDRLRIWVREGQAKALLQREARAWNRQKLAPQAVFQELSVLVRRFPGGEEALGRPELVGVAVPGT